MHIITAGFYYLDIDAYAGITAYAELLRAQGIPARAVSTAPLNESITKTNRSWPVDLETTYTPSPNDTFTVIDVSTPGQFDGFVDERKIERVIDHYSDYEDYWKKRIGDAAQIEFIGAASTLVYERWKKVGLLGNMSRTSARLLLSGILDNTLNFGGKVSTSRDRAAYSDLAARACLPADWPARYFRECQDAIDRHPVEAMETDSKMIAFKNIGETLKVGQLVAWDTQKILGSDRARLKASLAAQQAGWFMNVVSLSEGKSYFVCEDPLLQQWLATLLAVHFEDDIAVSERMWLRKEILRRDQEVSVTLHALRQSV